MKKIIENIESRMWIFLVGICSLLAFSSCNEDDMPYIGLDEEVIVLDTDMHKKTVDVKANVPWKATSDVAWCKVLQGTGSYKGGFEIIVEPNDQPAMRTATITVSGGSCVATLLVKQPAAQLALSVSEEEVKFGMAADKHSLIVVANNEWKVISSSEWCKAEKVKSSDNDELAISVTENTTGKTRQAVVSVISSVGNNKTIKTVTVTQFTDEHVMELPSEKYNVDKKAQEILIPLIISGKPYTLNAAADSDWLKATVEDDNNIKVAVEENNTGEARTVTVTVTMSGFPGEPIVRKVQITQEAVINELSIAITDAALAPMGESIKIPFVANEGNVTATSSSEWLTASISGNEINVSAKANNSGVAREGFITVTLSNDEGKEVVRTVKISQAHIDGYVLEVQSDKFVIDSEAKELTMPLITAGEDFKLDVMSDSEWLTPKKVGQKPNEIKVDVKENTTGETRIGHVTITMSGFPGQPIVRKVQVIQGAVENELEIPIKEVKLDPKGGFMNIPFKANDEITVQCSSDWFTATVGTDEQGNKVIKLEADANYTKSVREGYLTASMDNQKGQTIQSTVKITQDITEIKFELSTNECVLDYSNARTFVTLQSDGDWIRDSELPNWVTITPESGSGNANLEIIAKNNMFSQERSIDVVFTNKKANMSIILKVTQQGNPAGSIGFSHLGHGYNVMGLYAHDQYVKPSVLDQNKLLEGGHITEPLSPNTTEEEIIEGRSLDEYENSYTTSAGIGAEVYGFTASVETNFSEAAIGSAEHSFATFRHMTKKRVIKVNDNLRGKDLTECISETFKSDLENMSASSLVKKYGTHVILGFSTGGILEYSMTADSKMQGSSVDWGLAVEAGFSYCGMGGSASTGYEQYNSMKSENYTFEEKLICRGGESQYSSKGKGSMETYNQWLSSLEEPSKWVMIDYEGDNGLCPIWEFVENASKSAEIKAAALELMNSKQLGKPQPSHKFFQARVQSLWSNYNDWGGESEWNFTACVKVNKNATERFLKVDDKDGLSIKEKSEYRMPDSRRPFSKVYELNKSKEISIELTVTGIKEVDDADFEDVTMKLTKPVGANYWVDEFLNQFKDGEVIKVKAPRKQHPDEYIEFWYVLNFDETDANLKK